MIRKALFRHWWKLFFVGICVLVLTVPGLRAQQGASINGTVLDSSGAAVPGAQLTLTDVNRRTTRTTVSSGAGFFNFTGLPPATYSLSVSARGFQNLIMGGLELNVAQQMTVRPVLKVGGTRQAVTVTGTPPAVTTSSADISQTVQSQQIMNLPLNGRNPLRLMALVPGVLQLGDGGQFGMTQMQFSAPGTRATDVNYTLDGGTNNDTFYDLASSYPNPDALQEFTVTTRSVSAILGRGSTMVQAATKSGTNQFHGSAYEFVRNTQFDSRPFFASNRSIFKRNQFGGTLGGPVIKDKLFFFFGYQATRTRGTPGVARYQTLTDAERNGDFSALSKTLVDPNTGLPFTGNVIPQSEIQPFAQKLLSDFVPAGNQEAGSFYAFVPVNSLNQNQFIWHANYNLNPSNRVSFRYLLDNLPQIVGRSTALSAKDYSNLPTRHQNWSLAYTHVFSPTIINQLHATYDRDAFGVVNPPTFPLLDELGLDVNSAASITDFGLTPQTHMNVSGYFNESSAAPTRDRMGNVEISDEVSWVHGIHSLQFGTQIYWNRVNEIQNWLTDGNINFNGQVTGDAAADLLVGSFQNYRQLTPTISRLHQTLPSLFFEDDVRIIPRLTLNLGIRWDPFFGWTSENKALSAFIPGQQSSLFPLALPGLLYPGDAGLPDSIVGRRLSNFAPRVGLAWDVRGNGKTSVRASFGMFYVPLTRGISLNRFPLVPPFTLDITLNGGSTADLWGVAPFNGVNPYPPPSPSNLAGLKQMAFTPTSGSTIFALPYKTPVNQQWSMSVQQAIGANSMVELAYIGSSASHQFTSSDSNPAVYIPGQSTLSNIQSRRLYPYLGSLQTESDSLSSNYNAFSATFRKRYSHHVTVITTYTWAKALGIVGAEGEGSNGPRDPFNWALDYGPLNNNVRHNWVTSFIWDIPFGQHMSSAVLRGIAGGWQVNAINVVHSGHPFTIRSGHDTALLGIGNETADLIGDPNLSGSRSKAETIAEFFNTAAFAQPATGTVGTTAINTMTGPGFWDTDFGLAKSFKLKENLRLAFRGEFYNAFNHANLNNPNSTLSAGTFGRITGSGDPRVIELGAHLQF